MRTSIFIFLLILVSCESKPEQKHSIKLSSDRWNVAFLIMDGTYNTELTAPYDIFHHTRFRQGIKAMNVFTVAKSLNTVQTYEGLRIKPDFNYNSNELPQIDILVVPSAEHHMDSDLEDTEMINFIKETAKEAKYVTSHCDGSFVLAEAGLLDGKVSTSFPGDIEAMRKMFPKLDIRDSVLFVHDGKVITSAGGAKSFEASLYLCELLYGKSNADQIAEGMVINWDLQNVPHIVIED